MDKINTKKTNITSQTETKERPVSQLDFFIASLFALQVYLLSLVVPLAMTFIYKYLLLRTLIAHTLAFLIGLNALLIVKNFSGLYSAFNETNSDSRKKYVSAAFGTSIVIIVFYSISELLRTRIGF